MVSTRAALEQIGDNLSESMGVRDVETRPKLSPVASPKDIGRRPLRSFGRVTMDMVVPDPQQPRTEFSDEAIQHLAESIRTKGQLHPIRVRWSTERNKWLIISGERRWRATQAAGLGTIDCFFQQGEISASEILEQSLVENLLREDLKPMEQAQAFSELMDLNEWNGKQVAEALNVSASKVSRALALLDLPQEVQQRVNDGHLAARSAYELSKLPNESTQRLLADQATSGKLTHAQAKTAVAQRKGRAAPKKRGFKQSFFADNDIKVTASAPKKVTYDDLEIALSQALEEVRHYIEQGRSIL
jgi:ParB family chromosome partitioning protein